MSRFLKALSKVGLVELDEAEKAQMEARSAQPARAPGDAAAVEDIDRILAETRAYLGTDASPPEAPLPPPEAAPAAPAAPSDSLGLPPDLAPSTPPAPVADATGAAPFDGELAIAEGQPLEQLYAAAGLAESPYPAEKLIKVLDGLSAMPAHVRKSAILAMDAADDEWSIEDPILDAQRKIRALERAGADLGAIVQAAEAQARDELAAQQQYQQEATATIRQQIAELEAMLQDEVQRVTEQRAAVHSQLQATRDAAAREGARYEAEISRLRRIPVTFGDDDPSGPPPPPPPPPPEL